MIAAQKRKLEDRLQLLTPHASSSTEHVPSSPTRAYERVLPSRQYARPNINGDWYNIGRSSAKNDLALPSNNQLISRNHCKMRYLENEDAFEIKCMGYNGVSLRISDQVIYVKRDTGVLVQLHDECELELNVVGSLVEIERPSANSQHDNVLLPSSPVMYSGEAIENLSCEQSAEQELEHIELLQPLSPLPSSTGMMTPSVTPAAKRIRLDSEESAAKAQPSEGLHGGSCESSNALQPRKLDFSGMNTCNTSYAVTTALAPGKENIPPQESKTVSQHHLDASEAAGQAVPAKSLPETQEVKAEAMTCSEAMTRASTTTSEAADELQQDQFEPQRVDQEFIDMLLTILATSVLSPAPITTLTPFFPVETSVADIEMILRSQACVVEHCMTDQVTKKQLANSTWSYDPKLDTDIVRMSRLSSLQKPQRSLRPRTYQQMHTYEYEHSKYVKDCKAAGIKPVRFDGTRYRRTHSSLAREA